MVHLVNRSRQKRAVTVKPREDDEEQTVTVPVVVVTEETNGQEDEQRVIDDCKQFEAKGLLPLGSCQQHGEVRDYADTFFKRDLVEIVEKAKGENRTGNDELSLSLLKDMETRLQTELRQVQRSMQLLQSKSEQIKERPSEGDVGKAKEGHDSDDDEDDEEGYKDDKRKEENKGKKAETKDEKAEAKEEKKSTEDDED